MDLQNTLAAHVARYGTPQESIMPDIRKMMTTPILSPEEINRMAIGNEHLGKLMNEGYGSRNAAINTYGGMLKEDTASRLAGPTAIQHITTGMKNQADTQKTMNEMNPNWVRSNEAAKKGGEAEGIQAGNKAIADAMRKSGRVTVLPKNLQSYGIMTDADAVERYGKDWHTIIGSDLNAQSRVAAANVTGNAERDSAKTNAFANLADKQLDSTLKELKLTEDAIFNAGITKGGKVNLPALEAKKAELVNRLSTLNKDVSEVGDVAKGRATGGNGRPAPAKAKTATPQVVAGDLTKKYPVGKVVTQGAESYKVTGHTPEGVPYTTVGGKNYKLNVQ